MNDEKRPNRNGADFLSDLLIALYLIFAVAILALALHTTKNLISARIDLQRIERKIDIIASDTQTFRKL